MQPLVKAAVVQAGSILFDRGRTLQKAADLARDAAAKGAQIVVFPEAFVGGYPKGLDFGAKLGSRTQEGREQFRMYYESAFDMALTPELGEVARANRIHLVIGVIERDGGTLYCTILFFSPEGGYLGKHRKLMPTAMERLIWGFGDGSTLSVFDTPLGRTGAVICWENYMPLLRTAMYAKGVQLYCAPTVDDREVWASSMRHIAVEGRCFVLSACQYLRRDQCPPGYAVPAEPAILIRGGSSIVDPFGNVLAGPHYEGETILHAELDMHQIARGKYDLDSVGHYSRPDVFQLQVNERRTAAVSTESEEQSSL